MKLRDDKKDFSGTTCPDERNRTGGKIHQQRKPDKIIAALHRSFGVVHP
jgi:hypothetical protein